MVSVIMKISFFEKRHLCRDSFLINWREGDVSMKKWFCIMLSMLLAASALSACGGGAGSGGEAESRSEETEEKSGTGVCTLLTLGDAVLCGEPVPLLNDGACRAEIRRTENTEEAVCASLAFDMEKNTEEGNLRISGTVLMGPELSAFFDFDTAQEDDAGEDAGGAEDEAAEDDAAAEAWENAGGEAAPADVTEEAILSMMTETLSGMQEGAALQTDKSGGLEWKYGSAAQEGLAASALDFCAFAAGKDTQIYISAGASVTGEADRGKVLDQTADELRKWMQSFRLDSSAGSFRGGKKRVSFPMGGASLSVPAPDLLQCSGAALSVSCGENWLDLTCEGAFEKDGQEAQFTVSLKNAAAFAGTSGTAEEAASFASGGKALSGAAMDWKVEEQTEDDALILRAVTEKGGETCCADIRIAAGEDGSAAAEAAAEEARQWLAGIKLRD